jgi:mannosylglycerate hydrolase MGH1-like protein
LPGPANGSARLAKTVEESMAQTEEQRRLDEACAKLVPWKKWGPYLSERQWGTVREDYSANGDAWDYFTHDHARSRAYRWGEDGLAGVCDDHQILCFALAMWNEKDPILKERLFGLTNSEGNHGEDVKEYYFYLDSTPTHSYMKYLYKYPQAAYPYDDLVKTNRERGRGKPEYELLDTGVFNENKYFDVFVEYAKGGAEDLGIKISVTNRGPEKATLHLLPTVWFRNTWMWSESGSKPKLNGVQRNGFSEISVHHTDPIFQESLPDYSLYCEGEAPLLFTENESNNEKLFGTKNASPYVKDGFHNYIIHGQKEAVNPSMEGTKAAPHYVLTVGAGETRMVRLRLARAVGEKEARPFEHFDDMFAERLKEADDFYDTVTPASVKADPDRAMVLRQAMAGMLWSKQYFYYDVNVWLREHKVDPTSSPEMRQKVRNGEWFHMYNNDIISMPDKWEYPWYAAWDLAFHMLAFQAIDSDFAKSQLELILRNDYMHPNGQVPAYEWNFGDTNPPVHAYATMQIYLSDKERNNGKGDLQFLTYAFSKLLVNFTWWLNRKDRAGNNLFEGGFLGLDNIGVFDRSAALPGGGHLEQADGTAWMVFFSQQMLRIAVELALHYPMFEEFVVKFFEHTMWIAGAMDRMGKAQDTMWDDEDGFFYDVLRMPDGQSFRMKVRSMVGLLPLAAVAIFEDDLMEKLPTFRKHAKDFMMRHPELAANLHLPSVQGMAGRRMLSTVNEDKLRRILTKMLDEKEFFGPHGIRALSLYHREHPFEFDMAGQKSQVGYVPGDSDSGMFGGNSNWRGPVWMPVNFLLYTALMRLGAYYGDTFTIECPTGSGNLMTLFGVAKVLGERLIGTFVKDSSGRRPVFGDAEKFQTDPYWRDNLLFFEYFHGDTGAGVGASHQTGWTGCIARVIQANGAFSEELLGEHDIERRAIRIGQGQSAEDVSTVLAK